jgi:hypothetical protein
MAGKILSDVKQLLGFEESYDAYDLDITIHINSAFSVLRQIGASPPGGFALIEGTESWDDFLQGAQHVAMVKSYICLWVRNVFDPPTTSFALESNKKVIQELEWRLSIEELQFNPAAYVKDSAPFMWSITDEGEFPAEAKSGDLGIDPETGNVWRNR